MKIKPKYKDGELKKITVFLWFPMMINDECRWLEKATYIAIFTVKDAFETWWRPLTWVDE
jgi:hypothetical protein